MQLSQSQRELDKLAAGREKLLGSIITAERKGKTQGVPYMQLLYRRYLEPLAECIDATSQAGGRGNAAVQYGKFAAMIGCMDSKLVSLRAIQTCITALAEAGALDAPQPVGRRVADEIGRAVYREYLAQNFRDLSPPLFNSIVREFDKHMTSDERKIITTFRRRFAEEGYELPLWGFADTSKVGEYLLHQLVALGFVEQWTATRRNKTERYLVLQQDVRSMSLAVIEHVAETPRICGAMVEEPLPWGYRNVGGGFHTEEMQRLLAYAVQGKGEQEVPKRVIDSINALQRVQWQVNQPVLSIVEQAALAFDFGDVVSPECGPKPVRPDTEDPDLLRAWKAEASRWYGEKRVRGVKYLRLRKTLQEAHDVASCASIWFSYYADFRGRLYARSSGISPQGSDIEKGLIRFAAGKPIRTEAAERWFKIHGANKFGVDKVSYDERIKWVDDNHDNLLSIATDPLCNRSWADADCPVQFLAWVLEYAEWHKYGKAFESHLPVGLDGTCNGLQNFSALLRDEVGGAATNLTPGPAPRDIYALVAERATELLQAMPPSELRDAWLKHGLNRKITKRTTMTLPYGCTRFAASEFIVKDYLEKVSPPEIPKAQWGEAGNFLSHVVWAAIGDVVVKAREAMEWLKKWADHAVKEGKQVEWYAPTGLLVRNEYLREDLIDVRSAVFKTRVRLLRPKGDGSLDGRRIKNAVSPNFVHSIDAAHLHRTVLAAEQAGMHIAAIHDDFGVHAADTEAFSQLLRREFVAMHSEANWLQTLADKTGFKTPAPEYGELELNLVMQSPYFFG